MSTKTNTVPSVKKQSKLNPASTGIFSPLSSGKTPSTGLLWARVGTKILFDPSKIKNINQFLKFSSWDPRWDRVTIDERFSTANRTTLVNIMLQCLEFYKRKLIQLEEVYFKQDIYKIEHTDWGQKERTVPWDKTMIADDLTFHGFFFFQTGIRIYRKLIDQGADPNNSGDFEDSILDPDVPYVIKTSTYAQVLQDYRLSSAGQATTETSMAVAESWNSPEYRQFAFFEDERDPLEPAS